MPGVLSWQQVLEFFQCQSALIMMPLSQLSSDDLKNLGQALIIPSMPKWLGDAQFSQPSPSPSILGWDVFFRSASLELSEGRTCAT